MHFNKKKLSEICAAALIAGGATVIMTPIALAAATAAGTLIKNLATVTYQDSNGNEYSAQSNEAIITVKQVYSATLSQDKDQTAAAGQVAYIQHTLTNTGNGPDTYTLSTDAIANGNTVEMYLDSNGNGLADAGEQLIAENGTVTLEAGESAEIVLAVSVPDSAVATDTISIKMTAAGNAAGTVTDTGPNADSATDTPGGVEDDSATNDNIITVSDKAVLNYTKSAVLNTTTNTITYTLTITNTGNEAATNVVISDNLPKGMASSGVVAYNGLLAANGDDVTTGFITNPVGYVADEVADDVDYNNDGVKSGTVDTFSVEATDASIAPGQTVSISFMASYVPASFNNDATPGSANDIVKNTATLSADLDGAGPDGPVTISSNPTQTVLPQIFDVLTDDTNTGADATTNDGGDDNADNVTPANTLADDTQRVDEAPSGSTVLFPVVVTNTGNGPDTFDLSHSNTSFPSGTTFTYWEASGTVPIVDTNGEAGPDTGELDSGESKTIMVKAKLPAGISGTGPYTATVTSTSSGDTSKSNPVELSLGNITAPGVDLRDTHSSTVPTNADDDALDDTSGEYVITSGNPTYTGTVGGTVKIPFYIDNNSGASDAFQLSAGSSWDDTATVTDTGTMGALPAGWSVLFYKADASGEPTGQPITSTQLLAPNSEGGTDSNGAPDAAFNQYVAVITLPSTPALAPANYVADNDADTVAETMDANADGDGDQPIFIRIKSANSGSSDIMVDAIDVTSIRDISLTPPGANQIQPGGSVDYSHTLANTGNTDEELELSSSNSLAGDNWSNNISVPVSVDTDNNGIPDTTTNKPLSQLDPTTDWIIGTDTNGNEVTLPITDGDNDDNFEITIPAGVEIPMTPTVFAPANAPAGTVDTLTINATSTNGGPTATVQDISEVIIGQVRLVKTVAHDAAPCDGTPETGFEANLTTEIPPGDCAIWQIVAENQGDAPAMNVIIQDEVTAFTSYETGSLRYGAGNAGNAVSVAPGVTLTAPDEAVNNDEGQVVGDAITFFVGDTPDVASGKGGTLQPGAFATVRFSTKID